MLFLSALRCAAFAAEDGYVRLAIKGANVNLRPEPRPAGQIVAQMNTGDVFIAEKWPIILADDKTEWYKLVLAVDAKTDKISVLSDWNSRFVKNVAYVRSDFATVSPLAKGDMQKILATPAGIGYSYDIDPRWGEFDAITKNNFRFFAAYEVSIVKNVSVYNGNFMNDDAKVIGRYKSGDVVRMLGTDADETVYKVMDPSFKRPPGYIDADAVKQKRLDEEKSLDFSAFKRFCELFIGANVAEIARKWGATEVERRMVDIFDQGDYVILTSIKAPGMEASIEDHTGPLTYVNNFELSRKGAGIGGIYIGVDWCNKEWVRKLLGKPDDEDENYWRWNSEFQSVYIRFENGLVKSFRSEHRWAD